MFEAVEIFSHVGKTQLREAYNSSKVIPNDSHLRRIYVILNSMGLSMHFTSQELYDHVSLDVRSVESLTV